MLGPRPAGSSELTDTDETTAIYGCRVPCGCDGFINGELIWGGSGMGKRGVFWGLEAKIVGIEGRRRGGGAGGGEVVMIAVVVVAAAVVVGSRKESGGGHEKKGKTRQVLYWRGRGGRELATWWC
jgi:hypothetical protein